MADEITLGYRTGASLKYAVYDPDGTQVTAPTTDLPEEGATGYYHADNGDIAAGDIVMVLEGGVTVAYGEYKPEVVSGVIDADLTAIEAKVDTAIAAATIVKNVYNEVPQVTPTVTVY